MGSDRNAPCVHGASVDGLMRTGYTLDVCVVCGHEQLQTVGQQTGCRQCRASARRSFALFRELREQQ